MFEKLIKAAVVLVGAASLLLAATPAKAQREEPISIYPLTNSTSFTEAGPLAISTLSASNISSQPFPIWRGRGFTFNIGYYLTNASGGNFNIKLRFSTPVPIPGGGYVTNWNNTQAWSTNVTTSGTNEAFLQIPFSAATVDNVQYGQLYLGTNAASSTLFIDPTNTYVQVYP